MYHECKKCLTKFSDELKHFKYGLCRPCHPKREVRLPNCLMCEKSFLEVKHAGKNHCTKCYPRFRNPNKAPKVYFKRDATHCVECSKSLTNQNKICRNLCKKCYKDYYEANSKIECRMCGIAFDKPRLNSVCPKCKVGWKKILRFPEKNELRDMKLLVIKSKHDLLTDVDFLRIVSLYVDIFGDDENTFEFFSQMSIYKYCLGMFEKLVSGTIEMKKNKSGNLGFYNK